ncbi:MAG: ABC transporter ATP-binding protein [Selenomonadaceae bacterium]|nr:ABC transporter ATP-binding protein [Selenomonadaceae bacterium]
MIKFLWEHFKNYKASLLVVALCSILTAAVNLMEPFLTAKFIDEILIGKDTATFYIFIAALATISITAIAANWLSTILSSKMRLRINNRVVEGVMNHVYKVRGDFIFKTDMVYLSKRLDQDAIDLIHFAIGSMVDICINFALLCMAFGLLCSIGIKWGVLFVIIAILHGGAYRALEKVLFDRSTTVRETDSKYFTCLSDILLYVYSIKLHSLYNDWLKKFRAAFEKNFVAVMQQVKIVFWFSTSALNANAIFKVLIFLLGGLDVLDGTLTVGNFVALNGYYLLAMQSVAYFMSVGQLYQNALAAYVRIMEIKNLPTEINGTKILEHVNSIEISNVSFSFGEQKILTNFSKNFKRGKIYCIVGKNGAGKSTLINLICGMIRPNGGEIFFDGVPLAEVDMISLRKNLIAVVEQKDFIKSDTTSGGERRKVSINVAFKKFSDVLIMDEPDNNLDAKAISELTEKIRRSKLNRITLIISHDERLIKIADEVINF